MKKLFIAFSGVIVFFIFSNKVYCQNVKNVSNNGAKGAVGLGLLAGEVVVNIEAIAGVKKAWILAVTGLVAAGGGAAGGYFAETKPSSDTGSQVGVGLLAGGMAFFVPTMIITTAMLKHYGQKEMGGSAEITVEKSSSSQTSSTESEGKKTEEQNPPPAEEKKGEEVPSAMINMHGKKISLAIPPLVVKGLYSEFANELSGEIQGVEYHLGVFNFVF
jgi:hypothetical protein